MKTVHALRALVAMFAVLAFVAVPLRALAQVDVNIIVGLAPPDVPIYEQPYVPAPNEIWTPGFWAWSPGYYWVPGTWVEAPDPGLVWTPGYWAWNGYGYAWNQGYWATTVGYYGGIDYGAGYFGNGYDGGRWYGREFRYNTFVTRVDPRIVRNVYVDRTVFINRSSNRVCYVGGRGGLQSHPTQAQLAIAHGRHFGLTPTQREHAQVASQNRNLLASVNHGRPGEVAVARPYTSFSHPSNFTPVTAHDRTTAQTHVVHNPSQQHAAAPVEHHAAPVQHAAAPVEHHAAPVQHAAAPVEHHAAPVQHAAAPVEHHAAPVQHAAAPVEHHAAPVQHAAAPVQQHVAPVQHAAAPVQQHAAPAQHAAAPADHHGATPQEHAKADEK